MREYKFRGKIISGEWVFGNLTILKTKYRNIDSGYYISNSAGLPFAYKIIPETMGQYTGLKDKNEIEIYEGDILLFTSFDLFEIAVVIFEKGIIKVEFENSKCYLYDMCMKHTSIIGNIFEDPNFLEVRKFLNEEKK